MRNQVDEDRLKLFPKHQQKEYLRQCDVRDGGCNDAELVAEMRREGTLKQLNPKDYGIPKVQASVKQAEETSEGYGFKRGDTVVVKIYWPWRTEEAVRNVMSVLHDRTPAIRCTDGQVYPISETRLARMSDMNA